MIFMTKFVNKIEFLNANILKDNQLEFNKNLVIRKSII